jgi:hypothetical protein
VSCALLSCNNICPGLSVKKQLQQNDSDVMFVEFNNTKKWAYFFVLTLLTVFLKIILCKISIVMDWEKKKTSDSLRSTLFSIFYKCQDKTG